MSTLPVIFLQLTKIPNDNDYLAQIVMSPRGVSGPERFKLADADEVFRLDEETAQTLAQLKTAIDTGAAGFREMERLGEFLYNLIFSGRVERKLSDVMIQEKERPYRLCIRVDESAPLLETVPWEYMKRPDGFVALSLASVTRVLEDRDALAFTPVDKASMLLVYANPSGYGAAQRHAKIEAAATAFITQYVPKLETQYNLKIKKLIRDDATRENFLSLLAEEYFDIVHFIGHGEVLQGDGHIVMHDNERIPGQEIYSNLSNSPPRLFYFNSCSTAKASGRDPFSSVAQALIRPQLNSVPAVIGMQYEIDVDDSLIIAEEFYERLLNPESRTFGNLERSMDHARRKLKLKKPSWGIPVLFLQTRERVMLFGELPPERPPAQLKFHLASTIPAAPDLVNRQAEVATVRNLLSSDRRLLMVTGLPGVGRGSVVRAGLDEYLQDEREEIPIWLDFQGIKTEDATLGALYLSLDRILEAGLERLWYDQRRPLAEKLAELEKKIPNTAILILENIDVLLDEECYFGDEQIEEFFRYFGKTTHRIFIIVSSSFEPKPRRNDEEWNQLWQTLKVQRLKTDDAVELLRKQGLTHSDQELRSLAEALDGHPQALKILAASIAQGSVNLKNFVTAPTATRGLTGTFAEAMMTLLTEPEAAALKLWSVFRNPVLRQGLIEVVPGSDQVVDSLATKGMLTIKGNYYSLPTLVRSVAYAELQRDRMLLDDAHWRAASFFMSEVETETERINNYLEARYHLRERADEDSKQVAQQIAESLFQPLMDQGRFNELRVLIEESEPGLSNDFMVEFFRAELQGVFGDYDNAIATLELLSLRIKGDSFEQGSIANEIGVVLKERSNPADSDQMLEKFENAYDIFANIIKTSEDPKLMELALHSQAVCTYNRGLVYQYFRRGQTPAEFNAAYSEARKFFEAALKIYNSLEQPDEQGIALVFSQLGELLADARFDGNNPQQAEEFLRAALGITERIGKPRVEFNASYQLARFLRRQGNSQSARILFRRAADLAERIDLQAERAVAEVQIAEIDFKEKQYDRKMLDVALSRNEETLSYHDDLHSIRVQSDAYFLHGLLHLTQDDKNRASECFEASRSVVISVERTSQSRADARRIARGTFFLAQITLDREGEEAARAVIEGMREYFEKIGYKPGENEPVGSFLGRIHEWR
jgi:tetratricopeptide (TPR) repeat protein